MCGSKSSRRDQQGWGSNGGKGGRVPGLGRGSSLWRLRMVSYIPIVLPLPCPPIMGVEKGCTLTQVTGPLTLTPVPATVPVGFARVRCVAVLPPFLTVLPAQWHTPNPLFLPVRDHLGAGRERGRDLILYKAPKYFLCACTCAHSVSARECVWA